MKISIKHLIGSCCCLIAFQIGLGQITVQECDDIELGQGTFSSGSYRYETPAAIIASTTNNQVTVSQDAELVFEAGQYVSLLEPFLAQPGSMGLFEARIGTGSHFEDVRAEVPQLGPISSTVVGKFEKLQLGIKLSQAINDQVASYRDAVLNNSPLNGLNPYDPDHISLEAVFTSPTGNVFRQYGFYYRKYERSGTGANFSWNALANDYPWLVRFAPDETGTWTVGLELKVNGQLVSYSLCESFSVVSSQNPGYLEMGLNNRFLTYSDRDETWIGVGENLFETAICMNFTPEKMYRAERYIDELALGKGNLVRASSSNWNFGFEWEHLGFYEGGNDQNYCAFNECPDAQIRAYEMDNFLEYCTDKEIYILLTHFHQFAHFEGGCGVHQGDPVSDGWINNPYRQLTGVVDPIDFFGNPTAKVQYKKHLRYLTARWGWSTHLMAHQLSSEVDNGVGLKDLSGSTLATYNTHLTNWHDEMAQYLHQINPQHLVMAGFGQHALADPIHQNANQLDVGSFNFYGPGRKDNRDLAVLIRDKINSWDLPLVVTESGGESSHGEQSDVCTDVDFHNTLWTTSFSGAIANAMSFRWRDAIHGPDPFDPDFGLRNYSLHYEAVRKFWEGEELHKDVFHKVGANGGNTSYRKLDFSPNPNTRYEAFGLLNADNSEGFIWTYNNSNWWGNLLQSNACINNAWGTEFANNPSFRDNDQGIYQPENTNNTIELKVKDLTPGANYRVEFWETYGAGGFIAFLNGTTNNAGNLTFNIPYFKDGYYAERFDVAIKLIRQGQSSSSKLENPSQGVLIYPNPSTDKFVITLPTDGTTHYKVLNGLGQTVLQGTQEQPSFKLDLGTQAVGIYHLVLSQDGVTETHKLVKQD